MVSLCPKCRSWTDAHPVQPIIETCPRCGWCNVSNDILQAVQNAEIEALLQTESFVVGIRSCVHRYYNPDNTSPHATTPSCRHVWKTRPNGNFEIEYSGCNAYIVCECCGFRLRT